MIIDQEDGSTINLRRPDAGRTDGATRSYVVKWEIDIDAETPDDAARQALAVQRDPASIATVFDVTDVAGTTVRVDLYPEAE